VRHHKDRATYSGRDANHPRFSPKHVAVALSISGRFENNAERSELSCIRSNRQGERGSPADDGKRRTALRQSHRQQNLGRNIKPERVSPIRELAHGRLCCAPKAGCKSLLQRLKPLQLSPDRHPQPHQSHPRQAQSARLGSSDGRSAAGKRDRPTVVLRLAMEIQLCRLPADRYPAFPCSADGTNQPAGVSGANAADGSVMLPAGCGEAGDAPCNLVRA